MTTTTMPQGPFALSRLKLAISTLTVASLAAGFAATSQAATEMPPIPEVSGSTVEGDGDDVCGGDDDGADRDQHKSDRVRNREHTEDTHSLACQTTQEISRPEKGSGEQCEGDGHGCRT